MIIEVTRCHDFSPQIAVIIVVCQWRATPDLSAVILTPFFDQAYSLMF
jgi:hypothetical protein